MHEEKHEVLSLVEKNVKDMISVLYEVDEEELRWRPANEAWSIIQIAAHVCESIPFWIDLIDRVTKDPNTIWGRDYFSQSRLFAVSDENVSNLTVEEVANDLENLIPSLETVLDKLTADQMQNETVQFIMYVEIIQHIEGHIHQMKRNLSNKAKFEFFSTHDIRFK